MMMMMMMVVVVVVVVNWQNDFNRGFFRYFRLAGRTSVLQIIKFYNLCVVQTRQLRLHSAQATG